jgi:hypothetical protein
MINKYIKSVVFVVVLAALAINHSTKVLSIQLETTVPAYKDTFISIEQPNYNFGQEIKSFVQIHNADRPVGDSTPIEILNASNRVKTNCNNRHMVSYFAFDLTNIGVDSTDHQIDELKLTLYSPHSINNPVSTSVNPNAFRSQTLRVIPDTGWGENDDPITYNNAIYKYVRGGASAIDQSEIQLTYNDLPAKQCDISENPIIDTNVDLSMLFHEEYPVIHSFVASPSNIANNINTIFCPTIGWELCPYFSRGVTMTDMGGYWKLEFIYNMENNNIDSFQELLGHKFVIAIEAGRLPENFGYGYYTKEAAHNGTDGLLSTHLPQLDIKYSPKESTSINYPHLLLNSNHIVLPTNPDTLDYIHINNPFEQQLGHDWKTYESMPFARFQSITYKPFDAYERLLIGNYISNVIVDDNSTPLDYSDDNFVFEFNFTNLKSKILQAKNSGLNYNFRLRYLVEGSSNFLSNFPIQLHNDPCFVNHNNLPEWEPLNIAECVDRDNLYTLTDMFLDQMILFINNDPAISFDDITFIDMVVFGSFGEGSGSGVNRHKYNEYKPYLDAYLSKDFSGVNLLMMTDPFVVLPYATYEHQASNPTILNSVGMRRDSMGAANRHFSFLLQREHVSMSVAKDNWKKAPFVSEFFGINNNINGNKKEHVFRHAILEARSMKINAAQRLRYFTPSSNDECSGGGISCEGYLDDPDYIKELDIFLANMGSKYAIHNTKVFQCGVSNDPNILHIENMIANYGNTPTYLDWQANIVLENESNNYQFELNNLNLREIMPTLHQITSVNHLINTISEIDISSVPDGTYDVKIYFYNYKYNTYYQLFNLDNDPNNTPSLGKPSEDGIYLLGQLNINKGLSCLPNVTLSPVIPFITNSKGESPIYMGHQSLLGEKMHISNKNLDNKLPKNILQHRKFNLELWYIEQNSQCVL